MSERPALVLGSASPRRRDLLDTVRLRYEVIKPDVDEKPRPGEAPAVYAARNAREKGQWVADRLLARAQAPAFGWIVISADTIVVLEGDILEKPVDAAHAEQMVARLGGKTHIVITGVTMQSVGGGGAAAAKKTEFTASTEVRIKPLTAREVKAYVATGEPLDKAGGYAAQGIGSYMVQEIKGSHANVVGLPIADVTIALERTFGYDLWQS